MTFAGTPAYMAPEVLCSQRYNESVDVYAQVLRSVRSTAHEYELM